MKTQKMSLANIQGKLSRAEMKNAIAGLDGGNYGGCQCTGSVGAWIYTSMPSCFSLAADRYTYCRSHTAVCNAYCHT
jgi:hypothetical protein